MKSFLSMSAILLCACSTTPPLVTLYPSEDLSAEQIMQQAHAAAGGETWVRPVSLTMDGYAVFYRDGVATENERHSMWRVYDGGKQDAHRADGKVRIRSVRDGVPLIDLAFDGQTTSTAKGPQPESEADKRWASNFGFGVIRHALDGGYELTRLADDLVDGQATSVIRVIDPTGGETVFAIRQSDNAIVRVGFNTERGWHERIYSNFFSNPGVSWQQPGRVRLYYNGVKANEVIWTSFSVNGDLPDCLFRLPEVKGCRDN